MNPMSVILDLGAAAVLLICLISGARRGFVMTVSGLVSVVLAYLGAGILARMFGPRAAELLEPYLMNIQLPEVLDAQSLNRFSFAGVDVGKIDLVQEALGGTFTHVAETIVTGLARTLGYVLVAIVSFVVLCILFHLLVRAMDLVARLPVLKFLNGVLGLAAGILTGGVILIAAAWILGFFDAYITPEAVSSTYLYKYFADPPMILQFFR